MKQILEPSTAVAWMVSKRHPLRGLRGGEDASPYANHFEVGTPGEYEVENAIQAHRDLLGPTNSNEAPAGTIRGDFGTDIERNAAHGSDAPETAKIEISYFFNASEILGTVEAL